MFMYITPSNVIVSNIVILGSPGNTDPVFVIWTSTNDVMRYNILLCDIVVPQIERTSLSYFY